MEVVDVRVVVELEPVRALRQRAAIELLPVRVEQVDVESGADRGREDRQGEWRAAGLPGRIGLANPKDVGPRVLAGRIHMAAGVLSERAEARDAQFGLATVALSIRNGRDVRVDRSGAVVAVDV